MTPTMTPAMTLAQTTTTTNKQQQARTNNNKHQQTNNNKIFLFSTGPQQTEAISEAFKAFACLNEQAMPPVETPALGQLNADSNQPASLMHPANVDRACAPKPPAENATSRYYSRDQLIAAIRSSLGKDLVRSVDAIFQFDITGEQGGLFYLDLKNGEWIYHVKKQAGRKLMFSTLPIFYPSFFCLFLFVLYSLWSVPFINPEMTAVICRVMIKYF